MKESLENKFKSHKEIGSVEEVIYLPPKNDIKNSLTKLEAFQNGESKKQRGDPLFLYAAAFTADLLIFVADIGFTWTSPVIPKLEGPESPLGFAINAFQKSCITTCLSIGAAIGPLFAAKITDSLGRKKTMIILAMPILVSFLILAFTGSLYLYYLARFLHGLSIGSCMAVVPMYKNEITEKHNRGKFGCIMGFFISLGMLYPLIVGPILDIRAFTLSCTLPLFLFIIIFTTYMPESPHYLVQKHRKEEAIRALMDLRNKNHNEAEKEYEELSLVIQNEDSNKASVTDIFSTLALRKSFIISVGLTCLMQLSGINAVLGYMHTIFEATGSTISSNVSAILIGTIQVFILFVPVFMVEKHGRKIILLYSVIGSAMSLFSLGMYFFLQKHNFNVSALWWLPIASLIMYIITFNVGIGILPWTVMAEIFPTNIKSTAASLTASICYFTSSVVTLGFPLLSELLSMAECFWIFAFLLTIGAVFIYYVVPETRGKTVSEIQDMLSGVNNNGS